MNCTPKQDHFARVYVETSNAAEAYRQAYKPNAKGETVWPAASRLLSNCKVAARVAELQQAHQERHNVTVDDITEMLKRSHEGATDDKQFAAAVSAAMGMAKLHGLIVDKQQHGGLPGTPSIAVTITRATAAKEE